ncbi:MAG: sulfate permease [Flavobacteriaceae bacterium]|nr:sulfate permease [Flavobacteriaceae bacterium]
MKLKNHITILGWIRKYNLSLLKNDSISGINVAIVLIPQGIAYAIIAGIPPIYGLYTAFVASLIYSFLGTARQVAVGPVAMDCMILASGVSAISFINTENYISVLLSLTIIIGLIQLLMGILKLGFFVNFMSRPVVQGFSFSIAILIGLQQIKNIIGTSIDSDNTIYKLIPNIYESLEFSDIPTLTMGGIAVILILLLKKISKKIPSALILVIIGSLLVKYIPFFKDISIIKDLPSGLPQFGFSGFNYSNLKELLPVAITLAAVGYLELISIGKSFEAKQNEYKIDANKELKAIGITNIIGSFFGAFSASASFSRSSINTNSGAKTLVSSLFASLFVGLTLMFFTSYFYYLPKAILGAIIMVSVFSLIDFKEIKNLYIINKIDFIVLIITMVSTLMFGVTTGVLSGVISSIAIMAYKSSMPHIAELANVEGTNIYRNINRFPKLKKEKDILILRIDNELYFANSEYLDNKIDDFIAKQTDINLVILDFSSITNIDTTAAAMIERKIHSFSLLDIKLNICSVIGPVRDQIKKYGLYNKIGPNNFFMNIDQAVSEHKNKRPLEFKKYTTQTNK